MKSTSSGKADPKPPKPAKKQAGKAREKKPAEPSAPPGRPTLYSEELIDEICFRLFEGETLTGICADESMPDRRTVWSWTKTHPEFLDAYARARKMRTYTLADRYMELGRKAITVANGKPGTGEAGARVQAVKLEMDSIKFEISKANPSEFSDTVKTEISGKLDSKTTHEIPAELQDKIIAKTIEAAGIASSVTPPASFRGAGSEEVDGE